MSIDMIIKQNAFTSITASAKASVFAQVSKIDDIRTNYMSDRGRDAATRLTGVSLTHARMPGFLKPVEASQIMEFAAGKTQHAPDSFENVNHRSGALSTISNQGVGPGAKMIIGYTVESGDKPLDQTGQSKMAIVTTILNRSLDEFRSAFGKLNELRTQGREAMPEVRKAMDSASMKVLIAQDEVISNTELYVLARNDLATYGFNVSNFDKNAQESSLLTLAVRRYELDPSREANFAPRHKPAVKRDSLTMSM